MKQQTEESKQPNLLMDLPGTAWAALWAHLGPKGRLRLLQLCQSLKNRVIDSCQCLGLTASEASLPPGSIALLRAVLSRPVPLARLFLASAGSVQTNGEGFGQVLALLQQGLARMETTQWPAATHLKELRLQGMRITAEAAALMPQAFPHLTALQLRHCEMDTVALLAALRTCQHLSSLALEEPRHTDPAGLWAAGITEAEGAGHAPVMHDTVEEVIGSADASAVEEATEAAQCAAAVGKLLGSLQQLTALSLMMPCVPVAMKLLALGSGPWCSLQELSLREASGDSPMTEQSATKLALPALLACTSLTSLELRFKITHPSVMALVESPAMQGLRSLRLPQQWVNQKLLDLLLKCLPGLKDLAVHEFIMITQSRADAPCSWQRLSMAGSKMDVMALSRLPLHSLTEGLEVMDPKLGLGFVHAPSSAALVEAACTNLARCKPGIVSPHEEVEVGLICRPGPSAFRLLAFFPKLTQLGLVMEVGEEEVAALGQTGSAVKGVKSISCRAGVRPDFWSPTLWAVLPRLREIDLSWAVLTSPAPIEAMAQCCAAAPRPVTITGPWRDGANEYAALKARLAELPGCMARLE